MIGRRRRDVEGSRGGAGQARRSGAQGVANSRLVDRQGAEGGHPTAGCHRGRAAERAAPRIGLNRDRHVGGAARQVVELIQNLHRYRRADGHAGRGVGRLLQEGQVIGRRRRDVEGSRGGAVGDGRRFFT